MNERLFARLAELVAQQPVVVASVIEARGATPRRGGSRMLITALDTEFSIGGGEAESRVIDAARELLHKPRARSEFIIDLSGRPGSAGICGGSMRLGLRRWCGEPDLERASHLSGTLARGESIALDGNDVGVDASEQVLPDERLLIVGAGHCGHALYQFARHLDFDIWVFDERESLLTPQRFSHATRLVGSFAALERALDTPREVFVVLVSRDFRTDVAALEEILRSPPVFMGMLGSRRRIAEVKAALPQHADALSRIHAPVGIEIEAQTPHEIALSILAQLVGIRRRS